MTNEKQMRLGGWQMKGGDGPTVAVLPRGGTTWIGDLKKMQWGKNWILPKEISASRFFWDSHWLQIWKNPLWGDRMEEAWLWTRGMHSLHTSDSLQIKEDWNIQSISRLVVIILVLPVPHKRVPQFTPQSTYIGRDETGSVYLPTQLERTLQLYWWG